MEGEAEEELVEGGRIKCREVLDFFSLLFMPATESEGDANEARSAYVRRTVVLCVYLCGNVVMCAELLLYVCMCAEL